MKAKILVEYRGEILTLMKLAERCNISKSNVRYKLDVGNRLEGHKINKIIKPKEIKL